MLFCENQLSYVNRHKYSIFFLLFKPVYLAIVNYKFVWSPTHTDVHMSKSFDGSEHLMLLICAACVGNKCG